MPPSAPSSWARRNANARAKGYKNYYDYRIHDFGKLPASQPPVPSGEPRARLRGHRSGADLRKAVGTGDLVLVSSHSQRKPDGTFDWVEVTVVDARGTERTYRLTGKQLKSGALDDLIQTIHDAGGVISPSPSLDLHALTPEDPDEEPGDDYNPEDEESEFDRLFREAS